MTILLLFNDCYELNVRFFVVILIGHNVIKDEDLSVLKQIIPRVEITLIVHLPVHYIK